MSIHVTVAAIVKIKNEYLFVEEMIKGETFINQPAGHLEIDESLIDAVIRETHEETGWHVTPEYLVGIYQLYLPEKNRQYLRFCFYCRADKQDNNPQLDKEIIRTHWLDKESLVASGFTLRSPLVLKSIEDFENGVNYPLSILHNGHP